RSNSICHPSTNAGSSAVAGGNAYPVKERTSPDAANTIPGDVADVTPLQPVAAPRATTKSRLRSLRPRIMLGSFSEMSWQPVEAVRGRRMKVLVEVAARLIARVVGEHVRARCRRREVDVDEQKARVDLQEEPSPRARRHRRGDRRDDALLA